MADGTYSKSGMYATSTFGAHIISTANRHIIFNDLEGHFISNSQIENGLPYGRKVTIYDDQFNKLLEFQLKARRLQIPGDPMTGWHKTPSTNPNKSLFIHDDRWLVFVDSSSRWWGGAYRSFNYYGKSIGVLDLDNLENFSYQEDNAYGVTHDYTGLSFMGSLDIPRWQRSTDDTKVATIDGKVKIIHSGWIPPSNHHITTSGTWTPKIWIHDIEDIITQASNNPNGPDGLNIFEPEQELDIFVGDGTMKQYLSSDDPGDVVTVPQGIGPEVWEGRLYNVPRWLVPNITVLEDKILVSDNGFSAGYGWPGEDYQGKSELYEFTNGSWSSPTVINAPYAGGILKSGDGSLGYQVQNKYYPDIINPRLNESYIQYEGEDLRRSVYYTSEIPIQYVDDFNLTEPLNYPVLYWPEPISVNAESTRRKLYGSYNNGNLSPWISQLPRRTRISVTYNNDGTYKVESRDPSWTSSYVLIDTGRWISEEQLGSGSIKDPQFDIVSINYTNPDDSQNIVITDSESIEDGQKVISLTIQEADLSLDPSIPMEVEVNFKALIGGFSRLTYSEHEITVNAKLSGIANPSVDLTDPNVIINLSPHALIEWPDDAFTHVAFSVWKPWVQAYENSQNGFVSETLTIDANTESVEFFINRGYALNGQQVTFEFGNGWVDDYGDSLGTVVIDLHQSDIVDPNPRGDQFPEIIFNAKLGNITGGQDLSVTVSTFFDGWRQSSYDNYPISTTMTRTIPIQVAG
jgi:hypothetical protein